MRYIVVGLYSVFPLKFVKKIKQKLFYSVLYVKIALKFLLKTLEYTYMMNRNLDFLD